MFICKECLETINEEIYDRNEDDPELAIALVDTGKPPTQLPEEIVG